MAKSGKQRPAKVGVKVIKAAGEKAQGPVIKSDVSEQINGQDAYNSSDWIEPPYDLHGLEVMVSQSSILPQCIRAYKDNIAGFGIAVRYRVDVEETEEMAAEFRRAEEIIELLTIDQDTKELFENVIAARETYGIAYVEVIRDLGGNVVQIEHIEDVPSVRKTRPLEPYIERSYFHHGQELKRKKKFRKYRQQLGGKTVFFKEFGDPRVMDKRDGEYLKEGESLELEYHANEIMDFTIGTKTYGEVRWIGQLLGIDGSRRAEGLNNNYFINGRHTPLLIMLQGGTLTNDSYTRLQEYMNDIKGENGQHAFMVLEVENAEQRTGIEDEKTPTIEVKDLASILQKDELFQEYLDNNRKRVQSAFLLPDLYVGYTTDFNRATAQTAKEVTEEQVFQPERISLAWDINNKLLNGYQFRHVEAYFMAPNITNPDDLYKILNVANNAGGLTPNKAKDVVYSLLGETAEDFEGDWGNIPIKVYTAQRSSVDTAGITAQINGQIEKAQQRREPDEIVAVMKEVRKVLQKIEEGRDGEHRDQKR